MDDKEDKDYLKSKRDMKYNIALEKQLTNEINKQLKKYMPTFTLEAHFTSFKNGVGVLKTSFEGQEGRAYEKGFPQNGAFMPNGIRIVYDDQIYGGIVEFKKDNNKFIPTDHHKFIRFLIHTDLSEEKMLNLINKGISNYIKKAVHNKEGRSIRFETRKNKSGLYYENYFPY